MSALAAHVDAVAVVFDPETVTLRFHADRGGRLCGFGGGALHIVVDREDPRGFGRRLAGQQENHAALIGLDRLVLGQKRRRGAVRGIFDDAHGVGGDLLVVKVDAHDDRVVRHCSVRDLHLQRHAARPLVVPPLRVRRQQGIGGGDRLVEAAARFGELEANGGGVRRHAGLLHLLARIGQHLLVGGEVLEQSIVLAQHLLEPPGAVLGEPQALVFGAQVGHRLEHFVSPGTRVVQRRGGGLGVRVGEQGVAVAFGGSELQLARAADELQAAGREEQVIEVVRVHLRVFLRLLQQGDGLTGRLAQVIGLPGHRFIGGGQDGEGPYPEGAIVVARGQRVVNTRSQERDGPGDPVVGRAVAHLRIGGVVVLELVVGRVPGAGAAPVGAIEVPVEQVLAVVVPGGVEHPEGTEFGAVAGVVLDVDEGVPVVREDLRPARDAGADHELEPGLDEGINRAVVVGRGPVAPGEKDRVFGQPPDDIGVLQGDVAPHHHPLVVLVLENVVDALHVLDIHTGDANLRGQFLAGAGAEVISFVAVHIEQRGVVRRCDFAIDLVEELVAFLFHRADDARRFAQVGVLREFEDVVHVPEGLEVADQFDMVLLRVLRKLGDLLGRDAILGGDFGVLVELEDMLGVQGEHVHLELGHGADFALKEIHAGDGAAADVVGVATVAQAGPVKNAAAGDGRAGAIGADQLLEGLDAVEGAGGAVADDGDAVGLNGQRVRLGPLARQVGRRLVGIGQHDVGGLAGAQPCPPQFVRDLGPREREIALCGRSRGVGQVESALPQLHLLRGGNQFEAGALTIRSGQQQQSNHQ